MMIQKAQSEERELECELEGSGEECGTVACGILVAGQKKGLVASLW